MAEQTTKPARRASVAEKVSGNILGRSKGFKKLVDKIFKACDTTKSGDISKSELYVGTLSVHITLARYAGPAACFVSETKRIRGEKNHQPEAKRKESSEVVISRCNSHFRDGGDSIH